MYWTVLGWMVRRRATALPETLSRQHHVSRRPAGSEVVPTAPRALLCRLPRSVSGAKWLLPGRGSNPSAPLTGPGPRQRPTPALIQGVGLPCPRVAPTARPRRRRGAVPGVPGIRGVAPCPAGRRVARAGDPGSQLGGRVRAGRGRRPGLLRPEPVVVGHLRRHPAVAGAGRLAGAVRRGRRAGERARAAHPPQPARHRPGLGALRGAARPHSLRRLPLGQAGVQPGRLADGATRCAGRRARGDLRCRPCRRSAGPRHTVCRAPSPSGPRSGGSRRGRGRDRRGPARAAAH